MTKAITLLACCTLLANVGAQLSVRIVATDRVFGSVTANSKSDGFYLSAATDVSNGYVKNAGVYHSSFASFARVVSFLGVKSGPSVSIDAIDEATAIGYGFYSSCSASSARHQLTVTIRVTKPIAGILGIDATGRSRVDLGAYGGIVTKYSSNRATVISPPGMSFVIRSEARVYTGGRKSNVDLSRVRILFTPGTGNMSILGGPCQGPELGSSFLVPTLQRAGRLSLIANKVPATQAALFVFGFRNPAVPLPPLGCLLRTDVLLGIGTVPNNGTARLAIPIPISAQLPRSMTLRMQFLAVSNGGWISSNGVGLRFQ